MKLYRKPPGVSVDESMVRANLKMLLIAFLKPLPC